MSLWTDRCLETRTLWTKKNIEKIRGQRMDYYFRSREFKNKFARLTDAQKTEYFRKKYKTKGL